MSGRVAVHMKRGVMRGGFVMLVLVLSAAAASSQEPMGAAPELRWSIEGAAGVQLAYTGSLQSVAFGFAPTRALTLLIGAERSRTEDKIEFYPDGYAAERGGLVEFVSAELGTRSLRESASHPTRSLARGAVWSDQMSTSSSGTAATARLLRFTTAPARAFQSTGALTHSPTGD